jgi:hypothetical protein
MSAAVSTGSFRFIQLVAVSSVASNSQSAILKNGLLTSVSSAHSAAKEWCKGTESKHTACNARAEAIYLKVAYALHARYTKLTRNVWEAKTIGS